MKSFYITFLLALLFSFSSSAQVIDVVGSGFHNTTTVNVPITSPDNVDQIEMGVTYKSPDPAQGQVEFSDDNETENANWVQVPNYYGGVYGVNPNIGNFHATLTDADESGITATVLDPDDEDGIYSFYAFVYRDLAAPTFYSEEVLEEVIYYHNGSGDPYIYNIPILDDAKNRNIVVKIPFSELDVTNRMGVVEITAGDVTFTEEFTTFTEGESLYIGEYLLEDVDKDVTNVQVSIYSPDPNFDFDEEGNPLNGDSFFSSGVVVDVGTRKHCTYTQCFYGSYCGKVCGEINTDDFIYSLLYEDLVLGGGNNTLTLTQNDVDCLIGRLPGGGPSKKLNGAATCSNPVGIQLKNGRFKNRLLNETIALGLNLRADEFLGHLRLEDRKFKTWKAKDCSDPLSEKKGRARTYYLSQDVLDHLGDDNTVNDLFQLANDALAGENIGTLKKWQVTWAVAVINYGFKDCRILKGFYDCHKDAEIDSDEDLEMFDLMVYPNPMSTQGTIEFMTTESGMTTVEMYNMMGERVDVFMNEFVGEFVPVNVHIDAYNYTKGLYILYIRNGSTVHKQKITIVN